MFNLICIYNISNFLKGTGSVKKLSVFLSVLIPLIAVVGIAITVYVFYPSFSRTDIYNLAISLLVILISGVAVFSVLALKKDVKEQ